MSKKILLLRIFALCAIIQLLAFSPAFAGWSTPRRISEPAGGYYPQIIAQGDILHVIYVNTYQYDKVEYLRSVNGGSTWAPRIRISNFASTDFWSPKIIRDGNRLMALWRTYIINGVYHYNIGYSISNNNGLTWLPAENVFSTSHECNFAFAASNLDSLINIMANCTIINDSVYYCNIRSTNFGQSWSTPHTIFSEVQSISPDQISMNSNVHFAWSGRFDIDSACEVHYLLSTDRGVSWADNRIISDNDMIHSYWPAICANQAGIVRISWMDFKYSPNISTGDIFLRQSMDSGSTWNPEIQATFDHYAKRSDIVSIGDTIIVVWEDSRPENGWGSIYCTKSTDNGINWDEPYWVDADTNNSINPSIACSNGKIFLIWYDTQLPDSTGIYFSRYKFEADAIGHESTNNMPEEISLSAYPNPFNSSTTFTINGIDKTDIYIYDIRGRLVSTLHAREGKAVWDANSLSSGVYFARAALPNKTGAIKLIFLK